ncbi:hypothetical protein SmelRRI128_32005 (plasmid) [Sinorhizobium meliloti]|nr:hypothetical protein [Sinorhizobium meliloti]UFX12936.1 hypothetical protein SmelRRI128_32005 [Sinorhizobium meliloti]
MAESIRAANEVERLTYYQISRLLDRSVDTIREIRRKTGIVGDHHAATSRLISSWPRHAADILRTLKILLDGKGMIHHAQTS